jgi:hypothetical protein
VTVRQRYDANERGLLLTINAWVRIPPSPQNITAIICRANGCGFVFWWGCRKVISLFIFIITRVIIADTKKTLDRLYLAISKSVVFNIVDKLVVCCMDIVNSEGRVALYHNFGELDFFEKFRRWVTFLLILREGYVIISGWAGEIKVISKLTGN